MSKLNIGIVAAVSNSTILYDNLKQSPLIKKGLAPLLEVRGAESAGKAYNQGLEHFSDTDFIIFAHQDVYIPSDWYANATSAIAQLNAQRKEWAVLGVYGKNNQGRSIGRLWDSGMSRELGATFNTPVMIDAVDELLVIIKPRVNLRFDEELLGFHLFGADICASARSKGYHAYAIHAPVIHNSKRIQSLGGDYARAYQYLQKKWSNELPLNAVCSKITRWGVKYKRTRFGLAYRRFFKLLPQRDANLDNPKVIAKALGYE